MDMGMQILDIPFAPGAARLVLVFGMGNYADVEISAKRSHFSRP
jgi:hypothetical protein